MYLVEAEGKLADEPADRKYMGLVKKKRSALVRRVVEKVRAEEVCAGARCVSGSFAGTATSTSD